MPDAGRVVDQAGASTSMQPVQLPDDQLIEASRHQDELRSRLQDLLESLEEELGPVTEEERRAIDTKWTA
jgi:hypothetical protein